MSLSPVTDEEILIRFITDRHISPQGRVAGSAFALRCFPSGIDEDYVSVMRKDFQGFQPSRNTSPLKNPKGFLSFKAGECRSLSDPKNIALQIEPKPSERFPAHAGIYFFLQGKVVVGECLDPTYRFFLEDLAEICYFHDFAPKPTRHVFILNIPSSHPRFNP